MKKIASLVIMCLCSIILYAQDITTVFLSTPDSILYGVNAEGKDKLIANLSDTVTASIPSSLNGEVKRLQVSDDFISIQTSEAGSLQIKLLPLINDSKIICVVTTVCGKACDSYVQFYTTNWEPLPNSKVLFSAPKNDWFLKEGVDRKDEKFVNAYSALDMIPQYIKLNPKDLTLSLYTDLDKYLSPDDFKNIQPFLAESPIIFTWDKTSFK